MRPRSRRELASLIDALRARIQPVRAGMAARRSIAVRAATAIGSALAVGAALGDVTAGSMASQGCFAVLYGTQAPYRRRARTVALVAGGLVVSAVLGTLVAGSVPLTIVVGGVYATAASLGAIAARLGPPREFFPVMVFLLVTQMPADRGALAERAALVLAGGTLAWLLALAPAVTGKPGPEVQAAQRALLRIAELVERIGRGDTVPARHHAIVAVRQAVTAADDAGGEAGGRAVAAMERVERLLEAAIALDVQGSPPLPTDWPERVRALAAQPGGGGGGGGDRAAAATSTGLSGVYGVPGEAGEALTPPPDDAPAAARLHRAVIDVGRGGTDAPDQPPRAGSPIVLDSEPAPPRTTTPTSRTTPPVEDGAAWKGTAAAGSGRAPREAPAGRERRSRWPAPSRWWVLRQPHPRVALRLGLVVALSLGVGHLFGLDRPAWVATSAAAVLQGAHARVIGRRALHRAVGTITGVVLAGAVLQVSFSTWWLIGIVAALQFLVEMLITTAYGLAVVVITPLVVLLSELNQAPDLDVLPGVRLVDTVVGCVVAALGVLVTRPWTPIGRLPSAQAEVLTGIGSVLDTAFDPARRGTQLGPARRRLQAALLDLRVAEEEVVGDAVWSDPTADARWPITAVLERLAHLTLTFPVELIRSEVDRPGLQRSITSMATAIAGRSPSRRTAGSSSRARSGSEVVPPPDLASLPRTSATLRELAELTVSLVPPPGQPARPG